MSVTKDAETIILELHKVGGLRFGEFKFKSGIKSPIYTNLRILISYPKLMKQVAKVYSQLLEPLQYDRLGGIPYAGLPLAQAVSLEREEPWVFYRKETKEYGLGKTVEGEFKKGETVAVLDDLISKGDSKFEAVVPFQAEGLLVKDFVVLMDYGLGGREALAKKGYKLHAVFTGSDMVEVLENERTIDSALAQKIRNWITANKS